ncbi:uncharacterized protein V2V93DRAFT_390832 [Kockiozyma suomiensis]|uniref:uncharacterized protein n=1 Tax=Kockiozyma suomiensis TaxID=1337062 RepID=UPI0033442B3E
MDFAPYQSEEPSAARPGSASGGYAPTAYAGRPSSNSPPPPPVYSPEPSASPYTGGPMYGGGPSTYVPPEDPANAMPVNQYETSMPLRLDWECVIAYLALPPVGSVILLIFETKNDFVRFHGWQASLLFTPLFIVYIILSFSTVLSYIILAIYIVAALYLSYRVYRDSSNLERLELPVIGRLAADWVDSE